MSADPRCTEVNDQGARCMEDAGHAGLHDDVAPECWPQINPEVLDALIGERDALRARLAAVEAERDRYLSQLDKATARILTIRTEADIRIASLEADLSAAQDGRDSREVYAALKRAEAAEARLAKVEALCAVPVTIRTDVILAAARGGEGDQ